MKITRHYLFAILATAFFSLAFVACGGDDEDKGTPTEGGSFSKKYDFTLSGNKDQVSGYPSSPYSMLLSDFIGADKTNSFVPGSASSSIDLSNSYIQIVGLKALATSLGSDVILKNFTIKGFSLGDISSSGSQADIKLYGSSPAGTPYKILTSIYSDIVSNSKKSDVLFSFYPSVKLSESNGVHLEISIAGQSYKYYQK